MTAQCVRRRIQLRPQRISGERSQLGLLHWSTITCIAPLFSVFVLQPTHCSQCHATYILSLANIFANRPTGLGYFYHGKPVGLAYRLVGESRIWRIVSCIKSWITLCNNSVQAQPYIGIIVLGRAGGSLLTRRGSRLYRLKNCHSTSNVCDVASLENILLMLLQRLGYISSIFIWRIQHALSDFSVVGLYASLEFYPFILVWRVVRLRDYTQVGLYALNYVNDVFNRHFHLHIIMAANCFSGSSALSSHEK